MLAKKAQRSEADVICEGRAMAESVIEYRVKELKNSRDGQSQPVGVLRHMLTRGVNCPCLVALALLEEGNG